MKVLYLTHSSEVEGSGLALLNVVQGLRVYGIIPIVIFSKNGPLVSRFQNEGIECKVIRIFSSGKSENANYFRSFIVKCYGMVYNIVALWKLLRLSKKYTIDIIHSNTGILRIGYYLSKLINKPHVWHLREYQTLDFKIIPYGGVKKMRKLFADNVNHCIAITKGIYEYYELNSEKDVIIYDGVYSESYSSTNKTKNNYFLFVGSLSEQKGILDLINAFSIFSKKHPKVELLLAGRDIVGIESIIKKKRLANVKYLGVRNDIYQLMSKSKTIIVPSHFEGFGFITAEAMINHCLVIGRDTAGTKEQFDNGLIHTGEEIGLRFNTVDELVRVMDTVASKPIEEYDEMIERAYIVAQNYTIEKNCKEINTLYQKL